ncbi:restriction endonuclease [Xanthobacter autotrophicus]|uniref:restriction endonuclease n=1 Tax=Xanthobacter autotrophicus TaxID=280 RepID=UPI0037290D8D
MSAQQAEDLVASLLQEHHGGRVMRMTANANAADGGIDLYVSTRDDGCIQRAVQVKRRIVRDAECVTEVRNFIGAMVLAGITKGTFVTTASRFSREAHAATQKARTAKFKLRLELIDGEGLLELLRANTVSKLARLPPQVQLDQEWRDSSGRVMSARDLFTGDMSTWRSWASA